MTEKLEDQTTDDVQEIDVEDTESADVEAPSSDTEEPVDNSKVAKANKEAAKYRNQLRDKETELEALRTEFQQEREFLQSTLAAEQWRILDQENQSVQQGGGQKYFMTNDQLRKLGYNVTDFITDAGQLNIDKYRDTVIGLEKDMGLRSEVVSSAGTGPEVPETDNDFARKLAGQQYQD